jgi:hypothetical protein
MRKFSKLAKKSQLVKENAHAKEENKPGLTTYGRHTKPDKRSWLHIDAHGTSQVPANQPTNLPLCYQNLLPEKKNTLS